MTSERWQEIERVFGGAVLLSGTERTAFVERGCEGDRELRLEVESLLANYDSDPDFLEEPAAKIGDLGRSEPELQDPERIGPYRVIERIGAGGMGAVYLAERDDDQYRKRVAIKLVKRGMDSEQIVARFRAERQILASLDHPSIARLLEGGIAEDGRPYFVLEYVEGALPIDGYCQVWKLAIAERLRLFGQACDAVQYAHRKLIIHRDLKPSNLLVSKNGQVKLVDFGIAKLLDPSAAEGTHLALTHTQMRLLTPEYASPEQIRGEPLSTASDVYSLGVILYRLLTGTMPYRIENTSPASVTKAICEQDPDKPSTVAEHAGVAARDRVPASPHRLEGDLDNIALMALRKEPEARYSSAEALSSDIRRYLERRPVLARPQTAGYRLIRFVQRHTLAVVLSSVAALFLGGGVSGTVWQAHRARQERDRAWAEAQKAERVTDVLIDLFDASDPGRQSNASSMSVREFADRAQARLADELEGQPEVLARLETVMGRLNVSLARYKEARPLFEAALAKQRALYPAGHLDLAETLYWYSGLLGFLQDRDGANAAALEALAMRRGLLDDDDLEVANILERLGRYTGGRKELDRAEAYVREAFLIRQRLLPADDIGIGESLSALATIAYQRGEFGRAIELGSGSLAIRKRVYGDVHQAVAHELNNLGAYYFANGEYDQALETHREALRVRTSVFGSEHPYVAFSLIHLGRLGVLGGDLEMARNRFEEALDIRVAAYGRQHALVGVVLTNLGSTWTRLGKLDRGRDLIEEAVSILTRVRGDSGALADALVGLGRNQLAAGTPQEALTSFRDAVEMRGRISDAGHPRTAQAQAELARALIDVGEMVEAEALLNSALDTYRAGFPDGHLDAVPALGARGDLEIRRGRPAKAERAYREALRILESKLPEGHVRISDMREKVAAAGQAGRASG